MGIFMETKSKIARQNLKFYQGTDSFNSKLNSFSDMSYHEFVELTAEIQSHIFRKQRDRNYKHHQHLTNNNNNTIQFIQSINHDTHQGIPNHVDWRRVGAVTPVKRQGGCGTCWAFSAIGSLEGQYFLKTGKLVSLSEQFLIDCIVVDGCKGFQKEYVFDYIEVMSLIDTEEDYPYDSYDGMLKVSFSKFIIS